MARRNFRVAVDWYKEALDELPAVRNKIGIAHHHLKEYELAEDNYKQAIDENNRLVEAINNLGVLYFDQGDYRKAEGQFKRALQRGTPSAAISKNLCASQFARGRSKDGVEACRQALQLDPEILDKSDSETEFLLVRNPTDIGQVSYYLSQSYREEGAGEKADLYMEKSVQEGFDPSQEEDKGGGIWDWFRNLF